MIENKINSPSILNEEEIGKIKYATAELLEQVGVRVNNENILKLMAENSFNVDFEKQLLKINEEELNKYLSLANTGYTLYGRNLSKIAEFGKGKTNILSSSGQYMYYDWQKDERRKPTSDDLKYAVQITNHLDNIDITGALVVPSDINPEVRDIKVLIDLLDNTEKPIAFWVNNGHSAKYIVEILKVIRDGQGDLKNYPFCECFIEAISPLQFTDESLQILKVFAEEGLPIGFGPMAMQGATAPVTLAGTITQENAEILSGIVISQVINPGNPVTYWGIPHCMDMSTGNMSFGSPEQGLLALSLVQIGRSYGFNAIGVNLGLTDSNAFDSQSGFEKGVSMFQGILAGADILGHQGIAGQDSCASLPQLVIDNEYLAYLKRYFQRFEINENTISLDLIKEVGIGGNYLSRKETVSSFKKEIFIPRILNRESWDIWKSRGKKTIREKAIEQINRIEKLDKSPPIEDDKRKEINKIYLTAKKAILGEQ